MSQGAPFSSMYSPTKTSYPKLGFGLGGSGSNLGNIIEVKSHLIVSELF